MREDDKHPNDTFSATINAASGGTLALCFQCGTCTGSCPSGKHTALRTRKTVRRAQLGLKDDILHSDELWLCTTCYTCYERCPRGVEIVDIIMALRNFAVREGSFAEAHKKVIAQITTTGHMVTLGEADKQKREKVGLPPVPPTVLSHPKALEDVKRLFAIVGLDKLTVSNGGKGK